MPKKPVRPLRTYFDGRSGLGIIGAGTKKLIETPITKFKIKGRGK